MKLPRVSVIIPAHDRPELLRRAVGSVLAQTFTDLELIVVDDASAVPAAQTLADVLDPRLRIVSLSKNSGAPVARNRGWREAGGAYISFLDDDDQWHPDFLEKMTRAMDQSSPEVGVLYCAECMVHASGKVLGQMMPRHRGWIHQEFLKGEKSVGGTVALIRRACLESCGAFDEELASGQDWDLWIRISKNFKFDYIPDVLADMTIQPGRISSDIDRAIAGRERLLTKYREDFKSVPGALVIHLKKIGKLNAMKGNWPKAFDWFGQAVAINWLEIFKVMAWLVWDLRRVKGDLAKGGAWK